MDIDFREEKIERSNPERVSERLICSSLSMSSVTLPKRRVTVAKAARTSVRSSSQDKLNLNYFQQLIDVETVCENALRTLKAEIEENKELPEVIQEEEWKSQFDVPIVTKY